MALQVEIVDGTFVVAANLVGELLDIPSADVPALMRSGGITSVCEAGIGPDEGTFRLNLFHRTRHARLRINEAGRILHRSVIDFGQPRVRTKQSRHACDALPGRYTAPAVNRKIKPSPCPAPRHVKPGS